MSSTPIEFVAPLELPFADGELRATVRPMGMERLLRAMALVKPLADEAMAMPAEMIERLAAGAPDAMDIAWLYELLCERGSLALDLVQLATELPRECIADMLPDRFACLFALVVQVHADFFARAPQVFRAAWARMETALKPLAEAKPSPKPATP